MMTVPAIETKLYTIQYTYATIQSQKFVTIDERTMSVKAISLSHAIDIAYCDLDAFVVQEVHCEGVRLY